MDRASNVSDLLWHKNIETPPREYGGDAKGAKKLDFVLAGKTDGVNKEIS